MSAECEKCGFDLVGSQHDERGLWCVPCDLRAKRSVFESAGFPTPQDILEKIDDLERQLAEERARINCATNNGWLSDDLECTGEDGPACWKHLLAEARGGLEALEEAQKKIESLKADLAFVKSAAIGN